MDWYLKVLRKYAVFEGRARRKEYWMFILLSTLISFALGFLEGIIGFNAGSQESMLSNIYSLAVLIPTIAVGVRRMHDVDKSGWFLLIPIYSLILCIREGEQGENRFGTDPKLEEMEG